MSDITKHPFFSISITSTWVNLLHFPNYKTALHSTVLSSFTWIASYCLTHLPVTHFISMCVCSIFIIYNLRPYHLRCSLSGWNDQVFIYKFNLLNCSMWSPEFNLPPSLIKCERLRIELNDVWESIIILRYLDKTKVIQVIVEDEKYFKDIYL